MCVEGRCWGRGYGESISIAYTDEVAAMTTDRHAALIVAAPSAVPCHITINSEEKILLMLESSNLKRVTHDWDANAMYIVMVSFICQRGHSDQTFGQTSF